MEEADGSAGCALEASGTLAPHEYNDTAEQESSRGAAEEWAHLKNQMEEERDALRTKLANTETETQQLRRDASDTSLLCEQLAQHKRESMLLLAEKDQALEKAEMLVKQEQARADARQKCVDALQEQLAKKEEQIDTLQAHVAARKVGTPEPVSDSQDINALRAQVASLQEHLENVARTETNSDHHDLHSQLATSQELHGQAQRESEDLRLQLGVVQGNHHAAMCQAHELRAQLEAGSSCSRLAEGTAQAQDVADLHAKLADRDEVIQRMAHNAEKRSTAMTEESAALRRQYANSVEETSTLRKQLKTLSGIAQQGEEELRQLRHVSKLSAAALQLKAGSSGGLAVHREAAAASATTRDVDGVPVTVQEAAAGALFGDLELGRTGTTLAEIGLGQIEVLGVLDRSLQYLAVMMAWRADLRLGVFGLWILCHLLYMLSLLYHRFF